MESALSAEAKSQANMQTKGCASDGWDVLSRSTKEIYMFILMKHFHRKGGTVNDKVQNRMLALAAMILTLSTMAYVSWLSN